MFSLPRLLTPTVTRAPQLPYAPALGTTIPYLGYITVQVQYIFNSSATIWFSLNSTHLERNFAQLIQRNTTQYHLLLFPCPPAVAFAHTQGKKQKRTRCKGCETSNLTAPVPIRAGAYSLLNSRPAWKRSACHPSIPSISALLRLSSD